MAHEDEETEQHLLDKINHAIDKQKSGEQQNLLSKFVSIGSDFEELSGMLKERTNSSHKDWLSVRRENLYYLNNLLTEWQLITKKHSSFSPEVYRSYESIKKSLNKMKKELKGEESSSRGDPERPASPHQEPNHPIFDRNKEEVYRWSSRHGPRKVHGFEHKVMSMEREIVSRNTGAPFKAFGVVGVAGIGKTTLCQTIFGRVKNRFFPRIWVCLSKQPREDEDNRKEIVVRILKCLGIEDEVITDAGKGPDPDALRRLILLLRLQLIGKKYLIVIDDAWNDDKFFANLTQTEHLDDNRGEELAYGLPKGCGGTVILSSRSEALVKKMIGQEASLQYLKPLTDDNCDEIFKDTVIGYDDDAREFPQYLKDLKVEILKKCAGLPLAAKLLAQIAREQLPLKPKPPTTVAVGEAHETKHVLAAGPEHSKTGGVAGAGGSSIPDNEHKGGIKSGPSTRQKSVASFTDQK